MEAYHGSEPLAAPWRLTKLYTDAKKSYTSASPPMNADEAPEILSMHRKFRTQKDRLIAWGLEWTDDGSRSKDAKGNIDESIERAGLTEVVSSVMENIKGILDEVDALRARTAPRQVNLPLSAASVMYPPEKSSATGVWTTSDEAHYEDLIKDLTRAIDLLCDLSKHKRASRPSSSAGLSAKDYLDTNTWDAASTVVASTNNPYDPLTKLNHGPLTVPRIDRMALALPEEGPPPYNAIGNIRPSRTISRLRHHVTSNVFDTKLPKREEVSTPIMIEDACFDSIYKDSSIPLPMTRLDQLFAISKTQEATRTCSALPKLIGCFEYPSEPRYGLVYELPVAVQSLAHTSGDIQNNGPIVSLYQLLESASKLQPNAGSTSSTVSPPLEERFRLALELVSSFAELQRNSFTHQGFSSSSVALFPRAQSVASPSGGRTIEYNVRRPLITSFDVFSEYNIDSPPEMLHENLYRHPDDPRMKGPSGAENFNANFDLYSLGLVLLEIGLWHPLSDIFKEKYTLKDFQTRIEKIWIRRLAGRCGTAYMRAVQDCISYGNESSLSADALAQAYGRIKTRLHRCCLLDDEAGDVDSVIAQEPARLPVDDSLSPTTTRPDHPPSLYRQSTTMSSTGTPQGDTRSHAKFFDQKLESNRDIFQEPASFTDPEKAIRENPDDRNETAKKARYRFPDKKLPADVLDIWNNALEPRLARIVSKALQSTRESCEIFMCYTGESENNAKPTACVMCSSTKLVRAAVRRFFKYDNDKFDVAVLKGKIVRSKAVRRPANSVRRAAASSSTSFSQVMNPFHHQRPLCGASIGAFRNSEHMPPVSFGGVVVVDGHQYGLSVHHLIEDPEEDEFDDDSLPVRAMDRSARSPPSPTSATQAGTSNNELPESADYFEESDDEDPSDLDSIFGTSADSVDFDDMASEFSIPGAEVDDEPENGDTDGVMVGDGDDIIITQPALNDVADDFFPCEEDKDDDHLDSHSLGHVHASSGLRRCNNNGIEHEVDWALLKLNSDRVQTHNLVAGGRRYCRSDSVTAFRPKLLEPVCRREFPASEDLYPRHIAYSEQLSGLDVHCFGRTSGLKQGRISQMMWLVRFHGRRTFSRTWSVTGDFGVGGDSGAWVVDNQHGRVCGHVLAWSSTLGTAYISPMDVIFEDIRHTLSARSVSLPGGDDQTDDKEVGSQSEDEVLEGVDPRVAVAASESPMATAQVDAQFRHLAIKDAASKDVNSSPYLLARHVILAGDANQIGRKWTNQRSMLGLEKPTTIA